MDSRFKKGGVRQRQASGGASSSNAPAKRRKLCETDATLRSNLAEYLILQWAWGFMSPQEVQRISSYAKQDMQLLTGKEETLPDIDFLAGIGHAGRYPNNCRRDVQRKYSGNMLNEPLRTTMPMVTLSKQFLAAAEQDIFLPHVLFSDIHNNYPQAWRDRICPSTDKLEEFWAEMQGSPQLLGHPITSLPNYQSRAIPLALHGDGVPVTGVGKVWGKSLDVFSWCSLLGTGLTIEFTFYIYSIFQKALCNATLFNTKQRFWRILVWSLQALMNGLWPDRTWDGELDPKGGTPLAGAMGDFFCGRRVDSARRLRLLLQGIVPAEQWQE